MHNLAFRRLRRNSVLFLIPGLAALTLGGCPPVGPGTGNTNDNTPPGQDLITVETTGNGHVDQQANGNMVTLTPVADTGWTFDGWSGADGVDQSANPLVVDATQINSITANFIQNTEPPPPTPGDSDGDGVRDSVDQCPNTPTGTPVDATGCPVTGGADADGDGVPDSADRCANTAAGASVDATGCAPEQLDSDSDGVNDALDQCPKTPHSVTVDAHGCPVSAPGTPDTDGDGVPDDIDQCPNTPTGATVDANGCALSQLDTDGDGVHDDVDQCPNTAQRTDVDANGCPSGGGGGGGGGTTPVCGNGTIETGEQCDDGNTTSGDGCGSTCQAESGAPLCGNGMKEGTEECDGGGETALCNANCTLSRCGDGIVNAHSGEQCDGGPGCTANCQTEVLANDSCGAAIAVGDGTRSYSNLGATTDGPEDPACDFGFADRGQVGADIWYCYTASCTGTALVSLCGPYYDTKLAVYAGCDCPTAAPLDCSDDDCGTGVGNKQSRVTFTAAAGQKFLLRVGGYLGEQGDGRLTIGCNVDACANGTGDCLVPSPNDAPGCDDATCCRKTCDLDEFCCDVTWDASCAGEAQGVCTGSFAACAPQTGVCNLPDTTPGCDNVSCCNTVCMSDPFCCLTVWDSTCVDEANSMCFLTCGRGAGDCHAVHTTPGCDADACCQAVCTEDPFCCATDWDQMCVDDAAASPSCP